MTTPRPPAEAAQAAAKYVKRMCGDGLKPHPNLNEHVPNFMEDAFLAGAAWERSRAPETSEEAQRALRLQAMLYGRIERLVAKDSPVDAPESIELMVLATLVSQWENAEFPELSGGAHE